MTGGMERCCRLEQYRYALYTKFQEPKLYRLAVKGDWDMIPDRARSHPKEASFVHRYAPMDTALHRILRPIHNGGGGGSNGNAANDATTIDEDTQQEMMLMRLKAVWALLEANRQATLVQDSFGRTPLHLACMDITHGNAEAAMMMIKDAIKDGSAACAPDIEGRTPLHYLVARNQLQPNKDQRLLLSKLVALWPLALDCEDVVGETPLDILISRRDEWSEAMEVMKMLAELQQQQQQQEKPIATT